MEERRETFDVLSNRLYDAAIEGDVNSLSVLLDSDAHILERCCIEKGGRFTQSPLHVAADLGHVEFVRALLAKKPNMCFARDRDGMNPVHVAAINGQVPVLEELLGAKPQAAKELTSWGETVLHLCVKHRQRIALEFLVNATNDVDLLNVKDSVGNTVLHLAVSTRQTEMVRFLADNQWMDKNIVNTNDMTAMDICERNDEPSSWGIHKILKKAKALPAKYAKVRHHRQQTWSENQRDTLQVVASLIASMAFQVVTNPPGGTSDDGTSKMADKDHDRYKYLIVSNTIALIFSLSVVLLVISGLRYYRYLAVILTAMLWIASSATAYTYLVSVAYISKDSWSSAIDRSQTWSFSGWVILMAILILIHVVRKIIRMLVRPLKKLFRYGKRAITTTSAV